MYCQIGMKALLQSVPKSLWWVERGQLTCSKTLNSHNDIVIKAAKTVTILMVLMGSVFCPVYGQDNPPIVISEFMAINRSSIIDQKKGQLVDGDGESADWLELYNRSNKTANLEGWYLTDKNDQAWSIGYLELKPKQYTVIFASGKDRKDPNRSLHTDFKISGRGGFLALIRPTGKISHCIYYKKQAFNVSYGLVDPDRDTDKAAYFETATPGRGNSGVHYNGLIEKINFSREHGFYSDPVTVTLSSNTPGVSISYTTDGSEPTPESGSVSHGPTVSVLLNRTTCLRAIAFKSGFRTTPIGTRSYLFPSDIVQQTGRYGGLPIHFSKQIIENPIYKYKMIAALMDVPSICLTMPMDGLFGPKGIYDHPMLKGLDWERPLSVEWIDPKGQLSFQINAGVRIQGRESRRYPKKSFRLYFRNDYGASKLRAPLFKGMPASENATKRFDQLILGSGSQDSWFQERIDPATATYLRTRLTNDIGNQIGNSAAHGRFAHLYLNGKYWGLYHITERVNACFFATYYGGDKNNYDVFNEDATRSDGDCLDGDLSEWNKMLAIADSGLKEDLNYGAFKTLVDIDHYIRYAMLNHYCRYVGWFANNNFVFGRHRSPMSTWRFVPVDADGAYGQFVHARNNSNYTQYSGPGMLFHRLRRIPQFKKRFRQLANQYLTEGPLTSAAVDGLFAARINEIKTAIIAEAARWGGGTFRPDTHWFPAIETLRNDYIKNRSQVLIQQYRAKGLFP
jgi:hypothetical protein